MSVSMSTSTPPTIETPDHGAEPAGATPTTDEIKAEIEAKTAEMENFYNNGYIEDASLVGAQIDMLSSALDSIYNQRVSDMMTTFGVDPQPL